jgi:hypothetical protein
LYAGDEFDECRDVLEEEVDLKVHGGLGFFSAVIVAVVFALGVDPGEEKLQESGSAFE